MDRRLLPGLMLTLACSMAGASTAHDLWIVPSSFTPKPGELVAVRLRLGHPGDEEVVPRRAMRIVRFAELSSAQETPIPGLDGQDPAGYLRPQVKGLHALVYQGLPAFLELAADKFNQHLHDEGLDGVLAQRTAQGKSDQPGRELYSRSLKSLLVVDEAASEQVGVMDQARGLPLELVIATPDFHRAANRPLDVQLLYRGEPLAGALVDVRAVGRPAVGRPAVGRADVVWSGRSDTSGRIRVQLGAGVWVMAVVHSVAASTAAADWESTFSSLTFALTEGAVSDPDPATGRAK